MRPGNGIGELQWICGSTAPGMTICPAASTTRAAPMSARLPGPPTASAVDSLRAEIQYDEMELAGMKRLLPALEALYATLSPAQRQTANVIFNQGPGG